MATRLIQSKSCNISGMWSPPGNPTSRWTWDLWLKGVSLILATRRTFWTFLMIFVFRFFVVFWVLSWWTSLLCIVGEFLGWGSVAVGVGDMWQVKGDMWHVTCDMWHMTYDRWQGHMTCDLLKKFAIGSTIRRIERFGDTRIRDFFYIWTNGFDMS